MVRKKEEFEREKRSLFQRLESVGYWAVVGFIFVFFIIPRFERMEEEVKNKVDKERYEMDKYILGQAIRYMLTFPLDSNAIEVRNKSVENSLRGIGCFPSGDRGILIKDTTKTKSKK